MNFRVYIGTYTTGDSKGIYHCHFHAQNGTLSPPGLACVARNPSFLALHPLNSILYAVNEIGDPAGDSGLISAFSISRSDGTLTLRNRQPSGGAGPCHVALDRTGRYAFVANYGSGTVSVLPIGRDGELHPPQSIIQHEGCRVNPERQAGPKGLDAPERPAPHSHCISLSPQNRFALVADLGLDKVSVYEFNAENGALDLNDPQHVPVAAGAGPRHIVFHPSRQCVYVINELNSTITVYEFDPRRGALRELQTISTLPNGVDIDNTAAEVQVHPSGRFLFASNRGHDSIAMFAIHPDNHRLTKLGHHRSGGRTPRHFAIDPTGRFLLAANEESDNVVVHRIDTDTGDLATAEQVVAIPNPACIVFSQTERNTASRAVELLK